MIKQYEQNKLVMKMADNNTSLKNRYAQYLTDFLKLKTSTMGHYFVALNNISQRLKEKNVIKENIYEIDDIETLLKIKELLLQDPDFIEQNRIGHNMYKAGLNNYCQFATGEGLFGAKEKMQILDAPISPSEKHKTIYNTQKRSSVIRVQALQVAGFECEIDNRHKTFISRTNNKPYMEAHHIIAMKFQKDFLNSLDVWANVVCLCPLCHRFLHYGLTQDKTEVLKTIYNKRQNRLVKSGIDITQKDFIDLVTRL